MTRFAQIIKDWTIRRKILTGFAVVLGLTALLGWRAMDAIGRMGELSAGDFAAAGDIGGDNRPAAGGGFQQALG